MATLAQQLARLADNAVGDISAADMRDVVTDIWGKGGLIYPEDHGAVADGTTDDHAAITAAMAAAHAAGKPLVFDRTKTYAINQVIDTTTYPGVRLMGNGAKIRGGSAPTGDLDGRGQHIKIREDEVYVVGFEFIPPITAFSYASTEDNVIHLDASSRCWIAHNIIRGTVTGDLEGIMIKGEESFDNVVEFNQLLTAGGIAYSFAGANRTVCRWNRIEGSSGNALTGNGNVASFAVGNRVYGNTVINSGRMGVEDYGNIESSHIEGNFIDGTAHIAISSVGRQYTVAGNTVLNFTNSGIEVSAGSGSNISRNIVRQTGGLIHTGTGLIVNGKGSGVPAGSTVQGNIVEKCGLGIDMHNDHGQSSVIGNIVIDPESAGIEMDGVNAQTRANVIGNTIVYSTPLTIARGVRYAISIVSANGAYDGSVISGNHIRYETGGNAEAGAGTEYFIRLGANDLVVEGNIFDANGYLAGDGLAPSVGTPGARTGLRLAFNTFLGGARYTTTNYTNTTVTEMGNNIANESHAIGYHRAGTLLGSNDVFQWRDSADAVLARITSAGGIRTTGASQIGTQLNLADTAGTVTWQIDPDAHTGASSFRLMDGTGTNWIRISRTGAITPSEAIHMMPNGIANFYLGYSTTNPTMGFFGTSPIVKPTVSGSRADPEQALVSLLAALSNLGLITDSTTA